MSFGLRDRDWIDPDDPIDDDWYPPEPDYYDDGYDEWCHEMYELECRFDCSMKADAIMDGISNGVETMDVPEGIRRPKLTALATMDSVGSGVFVKQLSKRCMNLGFDIDVVPEVEPREYDVYHEGHRYGSTDAVSKKPYLTTSDTDGIIVVDRNPVTVSVLENSNPALDIDRMSDESISSFVRGSEWSDFPAVVEAVMRFFWDATKGRVQDRKATVLGRSATVGIPMALALLKSDANVTSLHTMTSEKSKGREVWESDLIVTAVDIDPILVNPRAVVADISYDSHMFNNFHLGQCSKHMGKLTTAILMERVARNYWKYVKGLDGK